MAEFVLKKNLFDFNSKIEKLGTAIGTKFPPP